MIALLPRMVQLRSHWGHPRVMGATLIRSPGSCVLLDPEEGPAPHILWHSGPVFHMRGSPDWPSRPVQWTVHLLGEPANPTCWKMTFQVCRSTNVTIAEAHDDLWCSYNHIHTFYPQIRRPCTASVKAEWMNEWMNGIWDCRLIYRREMMRKPVDQWILYISILWDVWTSPGSSRLAHYFKIFHLFHSLFPPTQSLLHVFHILYRKNQNQVCVNEKSSELSEAVVGTIQEKSGWGQPHVGGKKDRGVQALKHRGQGGWGPTSASEQFAWVRKLKHIFGKLSNQLLKLRLHEGRVAKRLFNKWTGQ